MKKVLFVLALVAVYGVSLAMTQSAMVSIEETVVVVNDTNDNVEKETKSEKGEAKAEAKGKAKGDGCSGSKAKGDGCSGSKAKGDGCDSKKTAQAKSGCSSSCGGK